MTATRQDLDELTRLRAQLAEKRQDRTATRNERDQAKNQYRRDPSNNDVYARMERAGKEFDELTDQIEDLRAHEMELLSQLGSGSGGYGGVRLNNLLGEELANPVLQGQLKSAADGDYPIARGTLSLGSIPRELVQSWTAGPRGQAPGTITPPTPPSPTPQIPQLTRPPTSFLAMLPSELIDHPSHPYLRREPTEGGVAPTPPGAVKPPVGWTYTNMQANTGTIAGYAKLRRQDLDDIPGLQAAVRTDLIADLRVALEQEVIAGTGAVSDVGEGQPGLVGLLRTTGLGSVPLPADGLLLDAVLDAMATIELSGGQANFLAAHTMDRAQLLKTRDGSGAYVFDPSSIDLRVWGLIPVSCTRIPLGKVIVGDSRGLTVLIRTSPTVTPETDQDDPVRNKITLVADLRAALAVKEPSFFTVIEAENGNGPA
jgi:Phage capsid family